jgi:hypothetical protein
MRLGPGPDEAAGRAADRRRCYEPRRRPQRDRKAGDAKELRKVLVDRIHYRRAAGVYVKATDKERKAGCG